MRQGKRPLEDRERLISALKVGVIKELYERQLITQEQFARLISLQHFR